MALVTDDRKHDTGAILAFMQVLHEVIREHLPQDVSTIHYVSDSPFVTVQEPGHLLHALQAPAVVRSRCHLDLL